MEHSDRRKLATAVCIGIGIVAAVMASHGGPPKASQTACNTNDLPYAASIKVQIAALCEWGMPRDEAIEQMKIVLRNPGINPERAADIVKAGTALQQRHDDPLRFVK